jgi:hypothetical protein
MKNKRAALLILFSSIAVIITAVSCGTVTRTVVVPPEIPGAKFVGSESCAQCHSDKNRKFANGDNSVNVGCESCHGPASLHISSGGSTQTILNPRKSPETCFQCHVDKRGSFGLRACLRKRGGERVADCAGKA